MGSIIKIIVAVMLLVCLLPMPYGYYTLVRFVSTFTFAYFAYECFKSSRGGWGFTFVSLAMLFQPFIKIALGRTMWNIVDVVVAVVLVWMVVRSKSEEDDVR